MSRRRIPPAPQHRRPSHTRTRIGIGRTESRLTSKEEPKEEPKEDRSSCPRRRTTRTPSIIHHHIHHGSFFKFDFLSDPPLLLSSPCLHPPALFFFFLAFFLDASHDRLLHPSRPHHLLARRPSLHDPTFTQLLLQPSLQSSLLNFLPQPSTAYLSLAHLHSYVQTSFTRSRSPSLSLPHVRTFRYDLPFLVPRHIKILQLCGALSVRSQGWPALDVRTGVGSNGGGVD